MPDLSRPARSASLLTGIVLLFTAASAAPRRADVPLASLDLTKMRVQPAGGRGGRRRPSRRRTSPSTAIRFASAERSSPRASARARRACCSCNLDGGAERFSAMVGADDNPILAPPRATGAASRTRSAAADADRLSRRRRRTRAPRQQAGRARRRAGAVRASTCAASRRSCCRSSRSTATGRSPRTGPTRSSRSAAPRRSRSTFPSSRARCSRRSPDRRRASTDRRSPA